LNLSETNKTKLLIIVSRFPYPLDKGDKLRSYYQIVELSMNFDITLVALTDFDISKKDEKQVSKYCDSVHIYKLNWFTKTINLFLCLLTKKPFQTGYFYSQKINKRIKELIKVNQYKHIYCQLIRTSEYVKKEYEITKTIDYMDALSAGISRRVNMQPFFKKLVFKSEANRLIKYERHIFDFFENKTIISEQDKNLIQHPERGNIVCVPNGIDKLFFESLKKTQEYDFVFVGNMSYPPNVDAVHYIAEKILPSFPEATLLVSGLSPHKSLVSLAKKDPRITVTGWVKDIRTSYSKGKIFLAPMFIGTGMQNKLLEAMAMKIPCVTTPLANNAIHARNGLEIMVGKNDKEIISCIKKLREDPQFSNDLSIAASSFVKNNYSWQETVSILKEIILK